MGQAEELIRMAKKLEKMVSRKNTTTKIGVAVNTVRKHCSDKEVVALAKLLIKNWKRLLESSGTQKGKKEKDIALSGWKAEGALSNSVDVCKNPDGKQKDRKLNKSTSHEVMLKSSSSLVSKPDRDPKDASTSQKSHMGLKKERRTSTSSNPAASPPGSHKSKEDSKDERLNDRSRSEVPRMPASPVTPTFGTSVCFLPSCYLTGDSIRDKCIEMVSAALKMDDDYKEFGVNCDKMAAEIEDHIFLIFGSAGYWYGWRMHQSGKDMKYRNRVRSRISNLKDPKNPGLRRNVLCGTILPALIAKMTAEEMASDELKELRNAMTQEAIREHQMAKTGGTATDLFQCGKCKKKNCTYNQVQTRSADEPMTTFAAKIGLAVPVQATSSEVSKAEEDSDVMRTWIWKASLGDQQFI
ncbi:hypothetical protein Chor_001586 [Crotalus horridus]